MAATAAVVVVVVVARIVVVFTRPFYISSLTVQFRIASMST